MFFHLFHPIFPFFFHCEDKFSSNNYGIVTSRKKHCVSKTWGIQKIKWIEISTEISHLKVKEELWGEKIQRCSNGKGSWKLATRWDIWRLTLPQGTHGVWEVIYVTLTGWLVVTLFLGQHCGLFHAACFLWTQINLIRSSDLREDMAWVVPSSCLPYSRAEVYYLHNQL